MRLWVEGMKTMSITNVASLSAKSLQFSLEKILLSYYEKSIFKHGFKGCYDFIRSVKGVMIIGPRLDVNSP